MSLSKIFIVNLIFIIINKIILDYLYITIIKPIFMYEGFILDINPYKYFLSWILYLLVFFILNIKNKTKLTVIYYLLFYIYVLPLVSYFGLTDQSFYLTFLLILPYVLLLSFTFNIKSKKIHKWKKGKLFILIFSFFSFMIVILHSIYITKGHFVINLSEVYSYRALFNKEIFSGIFGYLNGWVSKIFIVLLLAWAFQKGNKLLILLIISFIFSLFMFSGHKSVLESIFIVSFFYFLFKIEKKERFLIVSIGFFILLIIPFLSCVLFDNILISSLIIRRLLYVPIYLDYVYFEFFSNHSLIYWSDGILKFFIHYPYDLNAQRIIGEYLGHPDENANTGFIASGFMHFKETGIILYTSILIFLFNLINFLSKDIDDFIVLSILVIPIIVIFRSSDLPTSLFTHGFIISIFILIFYTNTNYKLTIGKAKYEI